MSILEKPVEIEDYTYEQFKTPETFSGKATYAMWLENCILDGAYGIEINVNDIFYGGSDSEYIEADDLWDLDPLMQDFGFEAVKAYVALMRDEEPWMDRYITDDYKKCKRIIRELKDNYGLFSWFEYGVSNSDQRWRQFKRGKKAVELLERIVDSIDEGDGDWDAIKEAKELLNEDTTDTKK